MFIARKLILVIAALVLAANHAQAGAAQLLYILTGDTSASFTVNTKPVPDVVFPDGFLIRNVNVTLNGLSQLRDVGFARDLSAGGLIISGTNLNLAGPQLFSGPSMSPTLLSGNFTLTGLNNPTRTFSLSVTPVETAVPEPQSWLLMALGFGLIGGALRMSRQSGMAGRLLRGVEVIEIDKVL
jgi:hypothetical protein